MIKKTSTKVGKPSPPVVKYTASLFIFTFAAFSTFTLKAQGTGDKPGIFYAITGNGIKDTSWLFGTYHLVNSSYLNEFPLVKESFKKSKGVVVEIIMDSSKSLQVQAMSIMKDKTLSELLEKAFTDSLENELRSTIGVGITQLNQLKPVTVTLTLSIMYLMKNNDAQLKQYTGMPLDAHFVLEGKKTSKNVTALETIEEQMDLLFNKTSHEEQAIQLKLFIRNKDQMIRMGDELMQSWFNHDLKNMHSIYDQTLQLSGEEDYLIKNRNEKWMQILPDLLAKDAQFIAVGALHLAGPDGLVEQLQRTGYTVIPIKK